MTSFASLTTFIVSARKAVLEGRSSSVSPR